MTEREDRPVAVSDRRPTMGLLLAACLSTLVVNANTSAVSILLPAVSSQTAKS